MSKQKFTKLSYRKYAEYRGVSDTTIRNHIKSGTIRPTSIDKTDRTRPLIIVERADIDLKEQLNEKSKAQYDALPDEKKSNTPRTDGNSNRDKLQQAAQTMLGYETSTEYLLTLSLNDLIKLKEIKVIQAKEMENMTTEGKLLDRDLMYKKQFTFTRKVLEGVLNVPDRIADKVIMLKERDEVVNLMRQELVNQMIELTKPTENMLI